MFQFINLIARGRARLGNWLADRLRGNFYLYLAAFLSIFAVADAFFLHVALDMKQKAFDAMVKHRISQPKPDSDIVILDIDEKSLSALSADYGRWPWPRQVLGEMVEHIASQKPKAIVFDILFSDPDLYNAASDQYFDEVIGRTPGLYFPMLRLDPSDDGKSQLKVSQIPGAVRVAGEDKTVALILPRFEGALKGTLGTHNIYPDDDGIARRYALLHPEAGWMLPSLPWQVGKALGAEPGLEPTGLLNWRGPAFTYHYTSFSDVYLDSQNKVKTRPANEFTGKVVIIGSTAPSLFDIKPTPMAKQYPGVEILATAIDNVRHDDFLHEPHSRLPLLGLALLIIWLTAWAFYRESALGKLDRLFSLSQFGLLGISYASLNLTNYYINLSGPVMLGVAYFSLARFYAFATARALETRRLIGSTSNSEQQSIHLLLARLADPRGDVTEAALKNLKKRLEKELKVAEIQILEGKQQGLWNFAQGVVALSWRHQGRDNDKRLAVQAEIQAIQLQMASWVSASSVNDETLVGLVHAESSLKSDEPLAARQAWQQLFADTLLQLDRSATPPTMTASASQES